MKTRLDGGGGGDGDGDRVVVVERREKPPLNLRFNTFNPRSRGPQPHNLLFFFPLLSCEPTCAYIKANSTGSSKTNPTAAVALGHHSGTKDGPSAFSCISTPVREAVPLLKPLSFLEHIRSTVAAASLAAIEAVRDDHVNYLGCPRPQCAARALI